MSRPRLLKWRDEIIESDLSSSEKLVLLALSVRMDIHGASCFPSMATVARYVSMTERGARGIVRRVERAGWLRVDQSRGRFRNSYVAQFPGEPGTAVPDRSTDEPGTTAPGNPERQDATRKVDVRQPSTPVPSNTSGNTSAQHVMDHNASVLAEAEAVLDKEQFEVFRLILDPDYSWSQLTPRQHGIAKWLIERRVEGDDKYAH
jgi:hypothetical protein